MSEEVLQRFLDREHARATATFTLDEELGTHHGLSWSDFVLLERLAGAATELSEARLATALGVRRSRLLMQTRPLEKLGWICRSTGPAGRLIGLSASGRRMLREARETAAHVCSRIAAATA
jgi:DNA-binding MarR family transcriptional regulator